MAQRTLDQSTEILIGKGLYTGEEVFIRIERAEPNSGITFICADADRPRVSVPAYYANVDEKASQGFTLLRNATGQTIQTPEHFMAAMAALKIDNANIVFVGPGSELSLMGGGCKEVMQAIRDARIVEQDAPRKVLRVLKTIRVEGENGKYAELRPTDTEGFVLDFTITVPGIEADGNAGYVQQHYRFEGDDRDFEREIAPARTFTTLSLAKGQLNERPNTGGNVDNVLVIDNDKANLNTYGKPYVGPLGGQHYNGRYTNDWANERPRHKILDAKGDTEGLLGMSIVGEYRSKDGGHSMNNRLMRTLMLPEYRSHFVIETEQPRARATVSPKVADKHLVDASLPCW